MFEPYILRPDAIRALEDSKIKTIFPRYLKVIGDQTLANFELAKKIEFNQTNDLSIDDLWRIHDELIEKLYETKYKVDKGELKLKDTKKPSLLDLKIKLTEEIMKSCELCEWECHVNRIEGETGTCKVGNEYLISAEFTHTGEEAHITPSHTVFFMGCNFHCQFCQNWSISQWSESGYKIPPKQLATRIEKSRKKGVRNVNFVGGEPTPNLSYILRTLKECEVNIPVVWNSNFYMSEKTMKILEGVVDMYLSDFKYGNNECALRLSKVENYFDVCSRNHLIAAKNDEITVRHLLLPNHIDCCTKPILEWIAKNIKNKCVVNIMDQYRPEHKAIEYSDIDRRITKEEFETAVNIAKELGINYIV